MDIKIVDKHIEGNTLVAVEFNLIAKDRIKWVKKITSLSSDTIDNTLIDLAKQMPEYSALLEEVKPTKAQLETEAEEALRQTIMEDLIAERIALNPYKPAIANVKAGITDGTIKSDAAKALRDEIIKQKAL